jgi:hypothetical protein
MRLNGASRCSELHVLLHQQVVAVRCCVQVVHDAPQVRVAQLSVCTGLTQLMRVCTGLTHARGVVTYLNVRGVARCVFVTRRTVCVPCGTVLLLASGLAFHGPELSMVQGNT